MSFLARIWNSPWLWLLMIGNLAFSVSQHAYWWNVFGLCACVFCFAERGERRWGDPASTDSWAKRTEREGPL